ncbi:MAG: response regulator [Cytophagaceae bacterium]|nr:response regulator [Cytophagaceae bacterium]
MKTLEKIVLIDDDIVSNFIAKKAIERSDLANRIKSISDPEYALKFLEERCIQKSDGICPELVLLDFNFPTTDAIEILEKLKCKGLVLGHSIVLVIVSTMEVKEDDKAKLKELKVSDFIVKPITEEKLGRIVEKYL